MEVVIGLVLVVALATLLKLGVRRVFRGPAHVQREARAADEARVRPRPKTAPRTRPQSGRTTPKGTRRR